MAPEVSSLLMWQNAQIFISIIMEFPLFYEALPTGEIGKGKKMPFRFDFIKQVSKHTRRTLTGV